MKKIKLLIAALALFACAGLAFAQENMISHGDFEGADIKEWIAEGSTITLPAGKGVNGSTALLVRGKYNWSGVGKDLTKIGSNLTRQIKVNASQMLLWQFSLMIFPKKIMTTLFTWDLIQKVILTQVLLLI